MRSRNARSKPASYGRRGHLFEPTTGFPGLVTVRGSQQLLKQRIAATIVHPWIIYLMSETSDNPTVRTSTATAPPPPAEVAPHRTPRVFQIAAWVAIVAGIVFVVAVIFFTGYMLGRHSGHGGFHHGHKQHAMMHHHRMGGPGGPGGPGATAPGGGPANVRPSAGVGQLPPSVFRSATTSSGAAGEVPTVIVLTG